MLFRKDFKARIRAGQVTRTYRTWKKPQAKVGAQYNLAPDGVISVTAISQVQPADITAADAVAAGFADADQLRQTLETSNRVYLIEFNYLGSGLIRQPDRDPVSAVDLELLKVKLDRMDARADNPWTMLALQAIAAEPGRRAGEFAPGFGWDTPTFKRQIRKLKKLGLTESLETGYRLSPRGTQLLRARA